MGRPVKVLGSGTSIEDLVKKLPVKRSRPGTRKRKDKAKHPWRKPYKTPRLAPALSSLEGVG